MPTHREIKLSVEQITNFLIEHSLSEEQQYPSLKNHGNGFTEVTFRGADSVSYAYKNKDYKDIYNLMRDHSAYNARLLDGGLIQLMYLFKNDDLYKHRLAFFPSPYLEHFQNEPEVYLQDDIYADVISRSIVPFPLRFDFDSTPGVAIEVHHPISHLTLGHYKNCRIPVTSALSPEAFLEFTLRNFYYTAFCKFEQNSPKSKHKFPLSISQAESDLIHIVVPA